jgi:hypothetical protein
VHDADRDMYGSVVWQGRGVGSEALVGSVGFELRKKSLPVWLRACASDKYDASMCIRRYMSLEM